MPEQRKRFKTCYVHELHAFNLYCSAGKFNRLFWWDLVMMRLLFQLLGGKFVSIQI